MKIGLANRGIWIKFNCEYCGKENEEKKSHYEKSKRHFCGHKCYCKYREKVMPSNEQPTWRGGITRITQLGRGNKKYKTWKLKVIKRDKVCIWCGASENLEVDHIKRWADYPKLRYIVKNGRLLCRVCHNKVRSKNHNENPELLT